MKLFAKEIGSALDYKRSEIISGDSRIFGLNPTSSYNLTIRKDNRFDDEAERNLDNDLYLNPTPNSYNHRDQDITLPSTSGYY